MKPKTIFFSVGEPSGDQHAARLITALHRDSAIQCRGFGGPEMAAAGCTVDVELTSHAVVGLVEVLPKLRDFFRFADQAEAIFAGGGIDAVVLVDFPGFNWHVAKRAKKFGIPVYYYCPPQLWAWGAWRVTKMRRLIDHVLAVLPIEQDFYRRHGIQTTLVGHPFFDAVEETELDAATLASLSDSSDGREHTIAVLPGSRDHEVHGNFPIFLETIRRLSNSSPLVGKSVRYAVASYRDRHCLWCRDQLGPEDRSLPIEFYVGKTSEIIEAADCAMMVSGSVSLEFMARQTPAAVLYRVGRLLHFVGRRVLNVDSITLPNLMSPRKVFPEYVSVGDSAPAIDFLTETIGAMTTDSFYRERLRRDLADLRRAHAMPGASAAAASHLRRWLGVAGSANDPTIQQTIRRPAA
ncbi:MAG: lipid-A-disaccharide synthase [Planctomycetota bacterium]